MRRVPVDAVAAVRAGAGGYGLGAGKGAQVLDVVELLVLVHHAHHEAWASVRCCLRLQNAGYFRNAFLVIDEGEAVGQQHLRKGGINVAFRYE